jgi:hypothetical protein
VKSDVLPFVLISQDDCSRTNSKYRMKREGITINSKSPVVDLWCIFPLKCFNLIFFSQDT